VTKFTRELIQDEYKECWWTECRWPFVYLCRFTTLRFWPALGDCERVLLTVQDEKPKSRKGWRKFVPPDRLSGKHVSLGTTTQQTLQHVFPGVKVLWVNLKGLPE
jgi:hypothetical protein